MTDNRLRPLVAIEVTGLLGMPLPPSLATMFIDGTGAEVTYRRGRFPTRFVAEPRWDAAGESRESWAFLGRGVTWVKQLLAQDVDVVWASRYQQFANEYFGPALGLPVLPVATLDDGRRHTSEAEWKASQLAQQPFRGRPLLWVNDELTPAGRYLLERWRRPADRAISCTKYIPDSASDGDVQFMNDWLELARSPAGQRQLRDRRARYMRMRRRSDFSSEQLHQRWVAIRRRLDGVVDFRSGLAAPLAAYAVDYGGDLDIRVVAQIREEWGLPVDPSAEVLIQVLRTQWPEVE